MKSIKDRMKPGDVHVVVSGKAQLATAFDHAGKKIWNAPVPARTWGQHHNWREPMGDTPPGLYVCGTIYEIPPGDPQASAYGHFCIDLVDLENQETGNGRAGVSWHGGGTGLANPLAPYQGWMNTHGCIRSQNADVDNRVVPLVKVTQKAGRSVYVTVEL